jgi:hypothetical protein
MPGKGSYGPGGKWIHDRAHRIMQGESGTTSQYGEKRGKQVAYAIATQQAHKMGRTPKKKGGYGTIAGRVAAKKKFDRPRKEYRKTAASLKVRQALGILKSRSGRRPVRVATLLKKASQSGADLRLPVMGGTKFPTNDSLSQSKQKLREHQNVGRPKMIQPVMQPVTGVSMPKLSSEYAADPLVQYLRKTAAPQKDGPVEDNKEKMITGPEEKPLVSADPQESPRGDKTHNEWRSMLEEHFANRPGITGKYKDHEYPYKPGVVDRVLGEHGVKG